MLSKCPVRVGVRVFAFVWLVGAALLPVRAEPNERPGALPPRPFVGTFTADNVSLVLKRNESIPGDAYDGTLKRGSETYNVTAEVKEGKLVGKFTDKDGDRFDFTAELNGGEMKFHTGSATLTLTKAKPAKTNPFDSGQANPFDAVTPNSQVPSTAAPPPGSPATPNMAHDPAIYPPSLKDLLARANAGDKVAMNRLGVIFSNGEGVEVNYKVALEWYQKAIAAGSIDAIDNLGDLYESGHGVEKDYAKALELYKSAAEKGSAWSMWHIGLMYADGRGVKQDYNEAAKWYRKSADGGDPDGMNYLAICYLRGRGVPKDNRECIRWLEKAADLKLPIALRNLGELYSGLVERNDAKAMEYFRRGAELHDRTSMRLLAEMYEDGRGVNQPDCDQALSWYSKAASAGDSDAKEWMAAHPDGKPIAPGQIAGKWNVEGVPGGLKYTLTLADNGEATASASNGSSAGGMHYKLTGASLNFDSSTVVDKLAVSGTWRLLWKNADEFTTHDENGNKLTLTRAR